MALSNSAQKRLISLHGWSAVLLSALLYTVVLTGTVVIFDNEIRYWSEGKADRTSVFDRPLAQLVDRFAAQVPPELHQTIRLGNSPSNDLRMTFTGRVADETGRTTTYARSYVIERGTERVLSAQAGPLSELNFDEPERALEEFLVDLHVRLHVPDQWGLYLTGLLGIAMLVAAVTGVLIHRHIIREMFLTERPGDRLVSVRDRHNLAGVWSLPFAVVLSFTGAFLSFAVSLGLPVVAISAFGGDQQKALDAVTATHVVENASPADLLDLDVILASARTQAGSLDISVLSINNYGRADAVVLTGHGRRHGELTGFSLVHSGTTGAFLGESYLVGDGASAGNTLAELMSPLHFGNFAGIWSKIAWAALGAAMTYTIVTGLQLWLRRRAENPNWSAGPKAMGVVIWGLPLAMMGSTYGYFLSRLTGDVEKWTIYGFLIAMVSVLMVPAFWRTCEVQELSKALRKTLGISLLLAPVLRLQTGGMSWGEALVFGGWDLLFIETLCLLTGMACTGWYPLRKTLGIRFRRQTA